MLAITKTLEVVCHFASVQTCITVRAKGRYGNCALTTEFWSKCYRRAQDDTVSTIFQWLYARMDAVHSGPKG